MATPAENLETSIANTLERIASVTASNQPDYSDQGRTISRGTYLTQLQQTLDGLLAMRGKIAGPFMVVSQGRA